MDLLQNLRFLVGEWRGEGVVRDAQVTARVTASERDDGAILLEHVTSREGAVDHRERVLIRAHRGRVTATIRPDNGAEQKFHAAPADVGVRFTRADPKLGAMTWEIVPETVDVFRERFVMGEGAAAETVVELRHVRVTA